MTSIVIEPPTPWAPHTRTPTLQRLHIPHAARAPRPGAAVGSCEQASKTEQAARRDAQQGDERGAEAQEKEKGADGFWYCANFISEEEERYLLDKIYAAPLPKWKSLHARSGRELHRLQHWGGQLSSGSSSSSSSSSAQASAAAGTGSTKKSAAAAALPTLIPAPMPQWYTGHPYIKQRLVDIGAFEASPHREGNSVLVNEYLPGQGIMPHEDGGAYFPAVATISLGSHTLLDIYRYVDDADATLSTSTSAAHADAAPTEAQAAASATTQQQEQQQRASSGSRFRAREQSPAFSILQEPRSLLLTRGDAYTSYMHGIAERDADATPHFARVINAALVEAPALRGALVEAGVATQAAPGAAGVGSIAEEEARGGEAKEGEVKREKRVSITVRDVPRVAKGLAGLLRRK